MNNIKILSWVLRITVAVIFLQTLYFKFTAHPESVYIFSMLGVEPYGRIALGVAELITAILILSPKFKILGFLQSLGIICGAIASHIIVIGTEINGDDGGLFILALLVFFASIALIYLHKNEVGAFLQKISIR